MIRILLLCLFLGSCAAESGDMSQTEALAAGHLFKKKPPEGGSRRVAQNGRQSR